MSVEKFIAHAKALELYARAACSFQNTQAYIPYPIPNGETLCILDYDTRKNEVEFRYHISKCKMSFDRFLTLDRDKIRDFAAEIVGAQEEIREIEKKRTTTLQRHQRAVNLLFNISHTKR